MARRVLLVEDNDDLRKLFVWLLRRAGFEALFAWNAENGLELLDQCPCDLAIFDVRLPGMSGLEALDIVARKRPTLPVLLMSASEKADEARSRAVGVRMLKKPFGAGAFLQAVRDAIASGGRVPAPGT